jgi:hypothetical protein
MNFVCSNTFDITFEKKVPLRQISAPPIPKGGEQVRPSPNMDMFTAMREAAVTDQMDPMAVVDKLVELTEAETTSEHNIVPADGVEELNKATGLDH